MKLPFSYKERLFTPFLLASFLGHLVFMGSAGFLPSSPQFAVEKAPSSMEVILLKERQIRKEKVQPAQIFIVETSTIESTRQREERHEKEKSQKKETIPPERGAVPDSDPIYLRNPAPIYPQLAREQGWEGTVVLKIFVESDGQPASIEILQSSGYRILDESAVSAVQKWQFLPTRTGGFTFSSWIKIPVRFTLVEEL